MRKQFGLLALFSLLLASSVLAAYQYYQPYYGGLEFGSFSGMFDNFWYFIENNQYVVDAVVFLVVYILIAKKVFYRTFSDDKALYIVIGIALTIGIMAYERSAGYSLIFNSAWLSFMALIAFAVYMASKTHMTGIRVTVLSILILVALTIILPQETPNFYNELRSYIGGLYDILMVISGLAVVYGIVAMLFPKIVGGKEEEISGGTRS